MPKQVYTIRAFHGGLNSNSDPRDIADDQLVEATDIMVDKVGRITTLGSFATHDTIDANTATVSQGRGLFQFSHDRRGGHLATEHLSNTGNFSSNWSGGNGWTLDSTDATYAHHASPANLVQTAADRAVEGLANTKYAFTYTISGFSETITLFEIAGTGSQFAAATTALEQSNGTHTTTFTSHATDPDQPFTINVTSGSSGAFNIDDVSLYIVDETGDDYLALTDAATTSVDIWSKNSDAWGLGRLDLGTETSGFKPSIYAVDGALRVCDGNYSNSSTSQWFGYIDRTNFSGLTHELALDGWYDEDQEIKAGTHSGGNITEAIGSYPTPVSPLNLDTAGYVTLRVEANRKDTGGMRGYKRYYFSLIYDGVQESKLKDFGFTDDTWENSTKQYKVCICPDGFDGAPFSKRVTGLKVYWKKVDSADAAYDDAYLLLTADFVKGVKSPNADTYVAWANSGSNGQVNTSYIEFTDEPRFETYRTQTGFSEDVISLAARYKTAVVVNRMTYIGNIKAKNKISPNAEVVMGDAMIKSPVNQFDSFPTDRMLEVTIRDGDEIIHLVEFADRILQFKKNKLYIINVSQEIEYLEVQLDHKGVNNPGSVAKTDMGIVWANKHGCFFYNGETVKNLLEKGGLKMVSDAEWDSFLPADKDPMVGYIPNKRQVIVADAVDAGGDGSIFLYDFVTQSWIKGVAATITNGIKSNFVNDWDGELIYHDGSNAKQWNDAPAASSISIKTKDIDFGQPGIKKNIYKVYVSYKGDGSSTTVKYGINGETDASDLYAFDSANLADKSSSENLESWHIATLVPGTSSQAKNIYSFQIILGGTAGATFEINDISIVYRVKGVR